MKTESQNITVTQETRSKLIVELTKSALSSGQIICAESIVDWSEKVSDELIKRGHVQS